MKIAGAPAQVMMSRALLVATCAWGLAAGDTVNAPLTASLAPNYDSSVILQYVTCPAGYTVNFVGLIIAVASGLDYFQVRCCPVGQTFGCQSLQTVGAISLNGDSVRTFPTVFSDFGFYSYTVYYDWTGIKGLGLAKTNGVSGVYGATTGLQSSAFACPYGYKISGFTFQTRGAVLLMVMAVCTSQSCIQNDPNTMYCGCPVGTYSSPAVTVCAACPVGTYGDVGFLTACKTCHGGAYHLNNALIYDGVVYTSSGPTSDSCAFLCRPGYGFSQAGHSPQECYPCDAGRFKSGSAAAECAYCSAGTYASGAGSLACAGCGASVYQTGAGGSACVSCANTQLDPPPGYYRVNCRDAQPPSATQCTGCAPGLYLSPPCAQNTFTPAACAPCPAGTYQQLYIPQGYAGAAPITCKACLPGKYTDLPGAAACKDCSRVLPANASWGPWVGQATSDACPVQCNWGFQMDAAQRACVACPLGKYTDAAAGGRTCIPCTFSLVNAYWLQAVGFNRSWNGCPWDCNSGYSASYATGACVPCPSGTFSSYLRTTDRQLQPNACRACQACVLSSAPGLGTYETAPCTRTQDRQCAACSAGCATGYYVQPCTLTADRVCLPCKTTCAAGQYMRGACSGAVSPPRLGACPARWLTGPDPLSCAFRRRRRMATTPWSASTARPPLRACPARRTCRPGSAPAMGGRTPAAWRARPCPAPTGPTSRRAWGTRTRRACRSARASPG